jgi:hypothetical protein
VPGGLRRRGSPWQGRHQLIEASGPTECDPLLQYRNRERQLVFAIHRWNRNGCFFGPRVTLWTPDPKLDRIFSGLQHILIGKHRLHGDGVSQVSMGRLSEETPPQGSPPVAHRVECARLPGAPETPHPFSRIGMIQYSGQIESADLRVGADEIEANQPVMRHSLLAFSQQRLRRGIYRFHSEARPIRYQPVSHGLHQQIVFRVRRNTGLLVHPGLKCACCAETGAGH